MFLFLTLRRNLSGDCMNNRSTFPRVQARTSVARPFPAPLQASAGTCDLFFYVSRHLASAATWNLDHQITHTFKCVSQMTTRRCVYDGRRARSTLPVDAWACGVFTHAFVFLSARCCCLGKPQCEDQTPWNTVHDDKLQARETTSKVETLLPSSYVNAMLILIHPHVHDCSLASQLILHGTTLSFFIFFLQPWGGYLSSSPSAAVYLHTWFWCVLSGQTQRASDDVSLLHK